jgi:hypothetical protein
VLHLLLLAGCALAVSTGALAAACLRLPSWTSFVLASFVLGWSALVLEVSALSAVGAWTRTTMGAALVAGCAVAAALWVVFGRPGPPAAEAARRAARGALGDRLVAGLAVAVAAALAYLVALGIAVPPGQWDELLYHLPRMVLWIQQDAVSAIPAAPGANLDANPVAAEIPQAVTLLLAGSDRYVALFQLLCIPVACLAIYGVARRLGATAPAALFGALLFATFPAVALQAPTGYNDLALAAALVVAAYFAVGSGRVELVLFALATGLAVGTKVSGLLGLPALALLVLVATTGRRRAEVAIAGLAGAIAGSWWYVYNLLREGSWDGGLAEQYNQVPSRAPDDVLLRLQRYLTESLDLSGVVGDDRFVFVVAALAVLAAAAALRRPRIGLAAAALVAVAPWLVSGIHDVVVRVFSRGWIAIGREDVIGFFPGTPATKSSTPEAWFGPALFLLVAATAIVVAVRERGRRRLVLLTACLGAPLLLALTNAAAFTWDPGRGRFFLFAAALAATTFGVLLRFRWAAVGLSAIAVVGLTLSLVHFRGRAMGIELFEPVDDLVAWSAPRWEVQSAFSRDHPEVGEALRVVEETIPADATIAIGRSVQMPLYHVMGGGPWRRTQFVRPDGSVPEDADWVALPLFVDLPLDRRTWRLVPGTGTGQAWRIYRRVGGGGS